MYIKDGGSRMLKYTSRSCTTRSSDSHRDIVFRSCQSVIRPCSRLYNCTCPLNNKYKIIAMYPIGSATIRKQASYHSDSGRFPRQSIRLYEVDGMHQLMKLERSKKCNYSHSRQSLSLDICIRSKCSQGWRLSQSREGTKLQTVQSGRRLLDARG